jgi:hypothetical protein
MTLAPKNARIPERFLFFGQSGGGRSNAIVTWMREQPDVHFHVIDNEDAYNFLIYEDDEINAALIEKENFTIYVVNRNDYDGNIDALEKIKKKVEAGDVVVLDKYGPYMWEATQAEFTRRVFGDEFAAYAVQMRADLEQRREDQKSKNERQSGNQPIFDQLRDWGTINTMQDEVIQLCVDINMMVKVHVVWIADTNEIRDNDKPAIRAMYKGVGEKPAGHKSCHAWPHTILHFLYDDKAGEYVITTVKDRGSRRKKKLVNVVWGTDDKPEKASFPAVYLGPVAGWTGAKKKKEKK